MPVFHGFLVAGCQLLLGKLTDYLAIIYDKVDVQSSKLVSNSPYERKAVLG